MSPFKARALAYGLAVILASSVGYDLWRMPIQVSDSLAEILDAQQSPSIASSFRANLVTPGYLRPLRIVQTKALFDLAQGRHYHLAYRGFHVILIVLLFLVFTRVLRVKSGTDAAAAAFALPVLMGMHTFVGFVRESFPVNTFLEIAILCLVALALAQSRGGWWVDAAAALVFVVSALTLESGLLVWVVLVAAWLAGLRGVSTRGLAIVSLLLAGYFVFRFAYLPTGMPTLAVRSSGFMFEYLEPDELQRRFGANPLPFYAYNIAASAASTLFGEPRNGIFTGVAMWLGGDVPPRIYLTVVSTTATTLLIAWAAVARFRRRAPAGRYEQLIVVSAAVLAANAVLSFPYTKDEIISVAGVFYALAAFAAARIVLERVQTVRRPVAIGVVSLCLLLLASSWVVRSAGIHHTLRLQAFRHRNDWTEVALQARREQQPPDPRARALVLQLHDRIVEMNVPNPHLMPEWRIRWFGD